jgi:hypothetical protein
MTRVFIEAGRRRVFASALDWPGWCRSGRDEEEALGALAFYAGRYAPVAEEAGAAFPPSAPRRFEVVERAPGNATTDFGAPGAIAAAERSPLGRAEAERFRDLVVASWAFFERVVAEAPAQLRKGPRGGGRDRDEIAEHVASAELAYAGKAGTRRGSDLVASRAAFVAALGNPDAPLPRGWPLRYAARRVAWHALDHAWEIEDKS